MNMPNLQKVQVDSTEANEARHKWAFQQLVYYPQDAKSHRFRPEKLVISIRNTGDIFSIVSFCGTNEMCKSFMFRLCFKYMSEVQKIQAHPDVQYFRRSLWDHGFVLGDFDTTSGILMQESPFLQAASANEMFTTFFCDVQLLAPCNEKLNEDSLYLVGPLSATILINVKGGIKKSDLNHLQVFLLYARQLQRFDFKTNLKNLIFVVHEFEGKQYGYNEKYLKTMLKRHSTPDDSFELLFQAFQKCACFCFPSVGKAKSTTDLPIKFLESFCEFASDLFTLENQNRNLSHGMLFETNASLTLDTAVSNMKAVNDGSKIIWTIVVQHTARHAYFSCIEDWIKNYAQYITEGIRNMTLETKYEDIVERANSLVQKQTDSFHKEFCQLDWFQRGSASMLKGFSMYGLMFEGEFKAERAKLLKAKAATTRGQAKSKDIPKHEEDMDGVFQKAISTFQHRMRECTGVMRSIDDVSKQYVSARDAAKSYLEENHFEEYPTENWELRMGRFVSYMDNMKDVMVKEADTVETKQNALNDIQHKAVTSYRDTMKESLNNIDLPFDESHKRSVKSGRKILTSSEYWGDQPTRKTMEMKFTDQVEEEKLFYQTVFKLKQDAANAENKKQMAAQYQQLMNKGVEKVTTTQEFKSLHGQSCSVALSMLKLSKKAAKENGDRLKKEMNKYKEKYKEIFDLKQEIRATEAKVDVFESEKRMINKAMMSFLASNDLLSSKEHLVSGRFPFVRKVWHNLYGNVAVKCKELVGNQNQVMEELKILTDGVEHFHLYCHENLIHVIGYSCWLGAFGAVLEHVDGMDLLPFLTHLRQHRFYPPPIVNIQFCVDIASALVFLASRPQLPIGDVTIDDVMVTRSFRCKVVGFKYENLFGRETRHAALGSCDLLFRLLSAVVCAQADENSIECIKKENYSCLTLSGETESPAKVDEKEERALCDALQSEIQDCMDDKTTLLEVRNNLASCLIAPNEARIVDQRWYKLSEYLLEAMKERDLIGSAKRIKDLVPISELWPKKAADSDLATAESSAN